ncbi:HicB family protein [Cryobacterium flavum]|uniref:HicB family protein n=2 Tax=Microbacteriaceae TaxID=85023 RepID=A0A5E9FV90_9MICO|nr:HicB family protein [Cryobacterium flavum]
MERQYHFGMAINVRIPEELDRQLEALATAQHVSKHALLLQGATLIVDRYSRRNEIESGLQFVLTHDAELLQRLEDA